MGPTKIMPGERLCQTRGTLLQRNYPAFAGPHVRWGWCYKKTTRTRPRREGNGALGDMLHARVGRVELVASSPCAVDRRRRGDECLAISAIMALAPSVSARVACKSLPAPRWIQGRRGEDRGIACQGGDWTILLSVTFKTFYIRFRQR